MTLTGQTMPVTFDEWQEFCMARYAHWERIPAAWIRPFQESLRRHCLIRAYGMRPHRLSRDFGADRIRRKDSS